MVDLQSGRLPNLNQMDQDDAGVSKRTFLQKHGIVRSAIRKDLIFFAIPAILVFFVGMLVSTLHWWVRMTAILKNSLKHPERFSLLTVNNLLGLGLITLGFIILIVAHLTIGRFQASTLIIREDHQLITHGIYSLVRHPIYLGVILVAMGIPICTASLYGFLIMSALVPVFLVRIRLEEKLLVEEFGEVYLVYRRRTRKLIPFIY
jgi:protein-S-isoprenylcysteine O-methyltransferase Ste14